MADVTGPISTLPGAFHCLPADAKCDDHPDRPAVRRVQGETDSFGSEMNDLCQECLDQHLTYARSEEARTGRCDWCKNDATDLRDTRDYDEGTHGPVYRVCSACVERRDKRLRAEMEEHEYRYGFDADDYEDDECWNCGGTGLVCSCLDEIGCIDPEGGCDLCERRCDVCRS